MDSPTVPRRAVIVAVCAVVVAAIVAVVLGVSASGGQATRPGPARSGPAGPQVHQDPGPVPTDNLSEERVERVEPAPMPGTGE